MREQGGALKTHSLYGTAIGFISVVLWGTLALFTELTDHRFPPFQTLAMTFTIASVVLSSKLLVKSGGIKPLLHLPFSALVIGICGLFFYHLFYFIALANAPAIEAGLIAYMWPLLIVLFSALLPGERLTWLHVLGAVVAFAGCFLLLVGDSELGFKTQYIWGYLAAGICALIWSSYSVLSRMVKQVSSDAVIIYCLATATLGWGAHFMFETTVWPDQTMQVVALLGLGIGPVGIAFFTWDYGVKHGNIQLLGTLAYAAPLISTLLLIAFGKGALSVNVLIACVAIVGGALIANIKSR